MAEFPALPIFTDAFIGDTTHLTAAQTGAYLMLLMIAWRTASCALPDDDEKLHRWARMDRRTWAAQKPNIMCFWRKGADGLWRQPRLSDERKHVDDVRSRNAEAGRASALKRKGRHERPLQPNSNGTSTPTPRPIPTESFTNVKDSSGPSPLEAAVTFEEFWRAYPKQVEKRKAQSAYHRALSRLSHAELMRFVSVHAFPEEVQFCKKPADWLDGDCWLDKPYGQGRQSRPPKPGYSSDIGEAMSSAIRNVNREVPDEIY